MGSGEKLPVAEVRREEKDPPPLHGGVLQMLQAVDLHATEEDIRGTEHERAHLDHVHAQVLEGSPADAAELGVAALRAERQAQVVDGDGATPSEEEPGEVAEAAADPQAEPGRKMSEQPRRRSEERDARGGGERGSSP